MMSTTLRRAAKGAVLAALAWVPLAQAETVVLQPVPGYVVGLSADGKTAVGQTADDFQTFRWTARGGVQLLGRGTWLPLGARSGWPAISADGQVIASTILADAGTYGTMGRWTVQGGWQQLTPPLPADGGVMDTEDATVFGMSRDGQVVTGLYWRPGQSGGSAHGARWAATTNLVDMGSSGNASRIDDANGDGSVLVGWDEHPQYGNRRAAVWVNGVKTVLEDSDWPSEAAAVNAAGTIVVGNAADEGNNFRISAAMWQWNGQQWTRTILGAIDGRRSTGAAYATAVSDDGSIVVGMARPDNMKPNSVGFVWTAAAGMQPVADYIQALGGRVNPLMKLNNVTAISGDGRSMAVNGYPSTAPSDVRSFVLRRLASGAAE